MRTVTTKSSKSKKVIVAPMELRIFGQATVRIRGESAQRDMEAVLTELMHHCGNINISFEDTLTSAVLNYRHERSV
jgi:hypothetical protein